jgi:hypothetical protein
MTIREFIVQLADKLAWPALVLALVLIFRSSLRELLRRLEHVGTKYGRLDFRESLDQAKQDAENAELPEPAKVLAKDEIQYYEELAAVSPRAVVVEAWLQLETSVERIIRRPPEGRARSFGPEARVLLKIAQLEEDEISLFYEIRAIRNEVVHQENAQVSKDQAIEYAQLALRLAAKIREKFHNNE